MSASLHAIQKVWHPLAGRTSPIDARAYLDLLCTLPKGEQCVIWPYSKDQDGYAKLGSRERPCRIICERVHGKPSKNEVRTTHSCENGQNGCVAWWHIGWKPEELKSRRKNFSVRFHPLFPTVNCASRSRILMAEKLGRPLDRSEHVHHRDVNVANDTPSNLELLPSITHHRLHRLGVKRPDVSVKLKGRKHTTDSINLMKNLTPEQRENRARAGKISGSKPKPWLKGRSLSDEHKEKIRKAHQLRLKRQKQ